MTEKLSATNSRHTTNCTFYRHSECFDSQIADTVYLFLLCNSGISGGGWNVLYAKSTLGFEIHFLLLPRAVLKSFNSSLVRRSAYFVASSHPYEPLPDITRVIVFFSQSMAGYRRRARFFYWPKAIHKAAL